MSQTTEVLRLTCSPGIWVLQGESQPIVYGSHLDNRLLYHHPVCILKSKKRLNTWASGPLSSSKAPHLNLLRYQTLFTSEPVSTLLSELSTFMAPLIWLVQGSQSPFLILEKVHFPRRCQLLVKKGNDNAKRKGKGNEILEGILKNKQTKTIISWSRSPVCTLTQMPLHQW